MAELRKLYCSYNVLDKVHLRMFNYLLILQVIPYPCIDGISSLVMIEVIGLLSEITLIAHELLAEQRVNK